jgi:hypothetical protein
MNNMTPDPQPEMGTTTNAFVAAPAEPKYEHEETGRLLVGRIPKHWIQ